MAWRGLTPLWKCAVEGCWSEKDVENCRRWCAVHSAEYDMQVLAERREREQHEDR